MKGFIKFLRGELETPAGKEWHQARQVIVVTACELRVATDARLGELPGAGARICDTCLGAEELRL